MFSFERKTTSPSDKVLQPGRLMKWYAAQQLNVDTIVFVHGILGDYIDTWGEFPKLLSADEDLPDLDILLWGYRTGLLRRHNKLAIEGGHLVTMLEATIRPTDDIVLVGHSMGGLIILKGLVDRMSGGHAQKTPCRAITWISLYASPLNGVWLAGVLRIALGIPLVLLGTLHKHLHDLSKGEFVQALMTQVHARIYQPLAEDKENRKIPIRIIAATSDGAVDKRNRDLALTPYNDPAAHQLDHDHGGVKLPTHLGDVRYRVLVTDLQVALLRAFKRLCATICDPATTEEDRLVALDEMFKRYRKMIRRRMQDLAIPAGKEDDAEGELLLLIANFGNQHELPPFIAINRAMIVLRSRHKDWRR